jgi:hypothetical protein
MGAADRGDLTGLTVSQFMTAQAVGGVGELPVGYDADMLSDIPSITTAPIALTAPGRLRF